MCAARGAGSGNGEAPTVTHKAALRGPRQTAVKLGWAALRGPLRTAVMLGWAAAAQRMSERPGMPQQNGCRQQCEDWVTTGAWFEQ
jgi:hypothetical protein